MLLIISIALAATNLAWALLRLSESIYQESKNPETSTLKKIIAVWKNFFKIS